MIQSLTAAASALQVNSTRLDVHANNIANLNTPGFQAQIADQETAPGGGVQISKISSSTAPGSPTDSENPSETNNVDLVTETIGSMIALRAFEANAKSIQTTDEMLKTLTKI
ncbi:MAG: flagellar basal body rod C-terminal domain-containing protein [Verrucomicrobiota bacterium]